MIAIFITNPTVGLAKNQEENLVPIKDWINSIIQAAVAKIIPLLRLLCTVASKTLRLIIPGGRENKKLQETPHKNDNI